MASRDLDKPILEILECVKADIYLFRESGDPDNLMDALLGIHRALENIVASEKIRNLMEK